MRCKSRSILPKEKGELSVPEDGFEVGESFFEIASYPFVHEEADELSGGVVAEFCGEGPGDGGATGYGVEFEGAFGEALFHEVHVGSEELICTDGGDHHGAFADLAVLAFPAAGGSGAAFGIVVSYYHVGVDLVPGGPFFPVADDVELLEYGGGREWDDSDAHNFYCSRQEQADDETPGDEDRQGAQEDE